VEDGQEKPYDLIVVCEGAKSVTRKRVGIEPIELSRERKQISGEVKLERHGMIIQYQHAKHDEDKASAELLLSLLLSTDDTKTSCWVIGDVSSEGVAKINRAALQSEETKAEAEEEEFRKIAARTMLDSDQNIKGAGFNGPVDVDEVGMFGIRARISPIAFAGANLVLAGDAVGEGHWSVGGGMHVAGMFHQRHLDKLAEEFLKAPAPRKWRDALQNYSDGVLADTTTWISLGIKDYYLSIPKDVLRAVFKPLVKEALEKKDKNFDVPRQIRERVAAVYFD
jgi:2-polyprenyl-6-methoxyphenol hydroxylase-like FAD-dependent oxidoreductase